MRKVRVIGPGRVGRSFMTVLAERASEADAAATLIANRVDLAHPGIVRRPADQVRDHSDLGSRLVTCHVPALSLGEITTLSLFLLD